MKEYIKDIEDCNSKLQDELSKCLSDYESLKLIMNSKLCYIIGGYFYVNATPLTIEVYHHLFYSPIDAMNRLKRDWTKINKTFRTSYEKTGFEFKFYTVESYNLIHNIDDKIKPVLLNNWAFETKKDIDKTIESLS